MVLLHRYDGSHNRNQEVINMDRQIEEIRHLIDRWFSFTELPPVEDIMPHLVFLLEKYDELKQNTLPEQTNPPH